MLPDWFWPAASIATICGGFGLYVVRVEIASRRRFPDDQHEHGRNPL